MPLLTKYFRRKSIKSAIRGKIQSVTAITAQLDALYLEPDEAKLAQLILEINQLLSELMILLGQLETAKSPPVFIQKVLRCWPGYHLQLSIHLRRLFARMCSSTWFSFQRTQHLYIVLVDESHL